MTYLNVINIGLQKNFHCCLAAPTNEQNQEAKDKENVSFTNAVSASNYRLLFSNSFYKKMVSLLTKIEKEEPPQKKAEFFQELTELIRSQSFKKQAVKIKRELLDIIKMFFELQMGAKDLKSTSWKDTEAFLDSFSKEELPPVIFLYMISNFELENNENQLRLQPHKLFALKVGECDDASIFAYYFLKKKGIETKVIQMSIDQRKYPGPIKEHVVCIFKEGDNWSYIDNEDIRGIKGATNEKLLMNIEFSYFAYRAYYSAVEKWLKSPWYEVPEIDFKDLSNFFWIKSRDCR